MTAFVDDESFDDVLVPDPYSGIPDDMKREARWLVYRMEPGVEGRKNKIPYDPKTGRKANDPKLGVSFEAAKSAAADYSGLGFYVESPYLVVDIDNCVSRDGLVADYAAEIIREMNTFSELSPSGTGIHVWAKGVKPGDACRRGIEIYSTKRFLTVTGVHVPGTPAQVREVEIKPIYDRMLAGEFEAPQTVVLSDMPAPSKYATKPIAQIQSSGRAITDKLQLFMTGEIVFTKPFVIEDAYGNSVTYPSQSEADGALATLLARKHKGNAEKIDADFRVSSLYRSKWDRIDYRDRTIKSAISFCQREKIVDGPVAPAPAPATPAQAQAAVQGSEEEEIIEIEEKLPEFPVFTGSLNDLCDAMSPDIPYPFKLVAAITHMGLIRSGLDTLTAEPHIQPRFYTALIAQPGRGKTAAINEVSKIMKGVASNYKQFSSIDSGPALVDAFNEQRKDSIMKTDVNQTLSESLAPKILLSPDEIKGVFEKAKITAGSRNSMLDELLKLYEGNTTGNRVRGAKISIHIENAHLGLLGGATEAGYSGMWVGTGGAADGLQSRIIPVGIEDRKMPSVQKPPDADKLAAVIPKLIEQAQRPSQNFDMSPDAFELFDAWWKSKDQSKASETRIEGIVKRLLIVLAATNDVTVISPDLMQQAIDFGDFVIACRDKFNPLDASTWCQAFENLIISVHQKHGDLTPNACRRLVHPERRPGGAGPFLQAYKNLVQAGILKECGQSQRSKTYRISL